MPGFSYNQELIGKLLRTYDDNYAVIYADTNRDPLIVPDSEYPLVGVRFDNVSNVTPESWDYEGNCKSGTYGHDIIKVLKEDDVVRLNNLKLLSEALYDQKTINWENSGFEGPLSVEEKTDTGSFILSFRGWKFETDGSNMNGLYILS